MLRASLSDLRDTSTFTREMDEFSIMPAAGTMLWEHMSSSTRANPCSSCGTPRHDVEWTRVGIHDTTEKQRPQIILKKFFRILKRKEFSPQSRIEKYLFRKFFVNLKLLDQSWQVDFQTIVQECQCPGKRRNRLWNEVKNGLGMQAMNPGLWKETRP